MRHGRFDVRLTGDDAARLGALLAQYPGQLAGVDFGNRLDIAPAQEFLETQFRAPVALEERQIADHQPGGMNLRTLEILAVGAGVADVGIRQGDDLASVGRIGQDFLVTGHRGVENHLSNSPAFSTN